MNVEHCWSDMDAKKTKVLRERPVAVPFCPPHVLHVMPEIEPGPPVSSAVGKGWPAHMTVDIATSVRTFHVTAGGAAQLLLLPVCCESGRVHLF
jgi:hypothetical protein